MQTVAMPSGPVYDPYKPVKVGETVELPKTYTVLRVDGVKMAEYDANRDLLLVDLTIGNKGKEKLEISSLLTMSAFTADWHNYSLTLEELVGLLSDPARATSFTAANVASFDGEVPAGQARKGTAIIPVPKDAKGLGFAFHPWNMTTGASDPVVYVGLGLKGDFPFPIIPETVQAAKAGTIYKAGQAARRPNGAWPSR